LQFINGYKVHSYGQDLSHLVGTTHSNIRDDKFGEIFQQIDNLTQPYLIIGTGEEPTDRKRIQIVYDYAVKYKNFKKIAACTCNFESDWEIKHFFSPKWMTPLSYGMKLLEEVSYQKTKLFHLINRVPRKHRIMTFLEVRKRGLENKGLISFTGGVDFARENLDVKKYIPDYPIFLDEGKIPDKFTIKPHAFIGNPVYFITRHALVGLICETSYSSLWHPTHWKELFISEKTFSCFSLLQIPIVVGLPGTVKWLRDHNFDMFDDIVDHSYDNELDPEIRYIKAVDQLDKLRYINPQALFDANVSRFEYNKHNHISLYEHYRKKQELEFREWAELQN